MLNMMQGLFHTDGRANIGKQLGKGWQNAFPYILYCVTWYKDD